MHMWRTVIPAGGYHFSTNGLLLIETHPMNEGSATTKQMDSNYSLPLPQSE